MTRHPSFEIGPFSSYDEMWDQSALAGCPFRDVTQKEELFRYDATIVDIVETPDGSSWLRHVADEGHLDPKSETREGPYRNLTHYLLFEDRDAIMRTIHEDFVPTMESYRQASEIVRIEILYDRRADGNHDFRMNQKQTAIADISPGELPDQALLPGKAMRFGPMDDPYAAAPEAFRGLYRYPVPQDRILAEFDGPRNWIGRFTDGPNEVHLVVCVRDDASAYVQHRITFEDEAALKAGLAAAAAPTMDTYRQAKSITRETIVSDADGPYVRVDPITVFELGDERPSFDSVAEHDAKWPEYAAEA